MRETNRLTLPFGERTSMTIITYDDGSADVIVKRGERVCEVRVRQEGRPFDVSLTWPESGGQPPASKVEE